MQEVPFELGVGGLREIEADGGKTVFCLFVVVVAGGSGDLRWMMSGIYSTLSPQLCSHFVSYSNTKLHNSAATA